MTAAGATDPVIGPADVPVEEGNVTIVYAIGSLEGDTLGVAVQTLQVGVEAAAEPDHGRGPRRPGPERGERR